jgi:hypothetical protein
VGRHSLVVPRKLANADIGGVSHALSRGPQRGQPFGVLFDDGRDDSGRGHGVDQLI